MGLVNDGVSVWVWGWWVGVDGSPLTLVCAQVWHGWVGVGHRWFGLGGWWVGVGRAWFVHVVVVVVVVVVVCSCVVVVGFSRFGVGGWGLVGCGLCHKVWHGWVGVSHW